MSPVDIFINSRGNFAALDAGRKAVDEFKSAMTNIAGISIGVGLERAFEGLKSSIRESVQEIVHWKSEMETAQFTIAAMQRQFNPGQYRDFNSALKTSAEVIDVIKKKANEMNVSIEDAVETYKTSAGAMFSGGIRDLQKQVDLSLMLQQAMRGLGIQGFQATRDIQDILTGRSHMTKAGRELGLHDEEIKKAEEEGRLYEFLQEKLGSYAEAGKAAGNTLNAELTRFHNEVMTLGADLGQPMFDELKKGVAELLEELKKPEFRESLKPLGEAAAEVAHAFFAGTKLAIEHADVVIGVGKAFVTLVAAAAAWKALEIGTGLAMLVARWIATTGAININTAALVRNAVAAKAAQVANAGNIRATFASTFASVTGFKGKAAAAAIPGTEVAAGGAGGLGIARFLPHVIAAYGGWQIGNFLDDQVGNPFRPLHRMMPGREGLGDNGRDDRASTAEREKLGNDQTEWLKAYQSISSAGERVKLENELKKKIEERKEAATHAGRAEKVAIEDSISALETELRVTQRVSDAQITKANAKRAAQAELSRLIGQSGKFGELSTDVMNGIAGGFEETDPALGQEKLRKQLAQAKEKTGVENFEDHAEVWKKYSFQKDYGDKLQGQLSASNTAKSRKAAGMDYDKDAILSSGSEEAIQRTLGQLVDTLNIYKQEMTRGIAAQKALHDAERKDTMVQNEANLAAAKRRGDGKAVQLIEDKMTGDKAFADAKDRGWDDASAKGWATEVVKAAQEERALALERFETETKIAALKKAGKLAEAEKLEREQLVKEYAARYGIDAKAAGKLADAKIAGEHVQSNIGAVRPEVDRYTRIGLFTGMGAQNPLEAMGRETNDWLKKIFEKLPQGSTTQLPAVGNY